ncbi:MAG: NAD(P)(+) transhydrogenase (Re/Si-specific) subunit beta [Gemmatimonadales bacterium]|nr:MAG: NAD(P)(+) transhydrogenase (Re/Si-specific) subunit beta [Gemmatimonadales bacterium]
MALLAQQLAYIASAVLFVWGLKRLGSPDTARSGNALSASAMLLALATTLIAGEVISWTVLLVALAIGSIAGALLARLVRMTAMPQLVAVFNGFGGGASALVAAAEFLRLEASGAQGGHPALLVTIALGILVGTVTFTGSFVAFGKLQGLLPGRPVTWPLQRVLSGLLFVSLIVLGALLAGVGAELEFVAALDGWEVLALLGLGAALLGIALVLPIGGADMPVVVSLLNSYSGLAAAAAGFAIGNPLLILAGALVGAAGLILTRIMCRSMNRSLANVAFGAFGGAGATATADDGERPVRRTTTEETALLLAYASSVVVVPGYGLAVAQAQHETRKLMDLLVERGVKVSFAIHPVAGRMPGHMNVLLAEADVPYDRLLDLDEANPEFSRTDVVVVVGANDVVNPLAREADSPISGMPILNVDEARSVVVIKRSLSPGFAGLDNPLFYLDHTLMLFSDAREAMADLAREVRELK